MCLKVFFKESSGNFYLRGLRIVVAGLFSFWGGCVMFGAFNFFLQSKNGLKGLGGLILVPNGGKMFHCRTQEA